MVAAHFQHMPMEAHMPTAPKPKTEPQPSWTPTRVASKRKHMAIDVAADIHAELKRIADAAGISLKEFTAAALRAALAK